ncbi:MAG TPA: FoF1 ATP synthase subunit a [Candidatus Acidoferrales bacterium]|nr:FoF1 ATP synthase subunit a [Candidatus Acidoferrales bacterium]
MGEGQVLGITKLVNWLLGKPAVAILALLDVHPANSHYPIPNFFAMELVVFLFAVIFFLWLKARMSVDSPGATQQCMEFFLSNPMGVGVKDLLDDIIGHGSEKHLAIIGSIAMFVVISNLAGLVPGFMSPTAEKTVPLGCAAVVFLYYHWQGLRHLGPVGYAKTFMGPVRGISPAMVIVESVSHLGRLLSLTVRLWANMMVGEMLYMLFLGITIVLVLFVGKLNVLGYGLGFLPVGIPMLFIILHAFESILQAFIFTILPIVYLAFAVSEEH